MEEKYTKLKRNAVSIIMTNVSLKMLLMFFDVWMYDREVRTPTQCRIAILGTWHRCHNRKKGRGGGGQRNKNTEHDRFFPP